ncbi:disease resistance protein RPM1-like [Oryza brachyantha]|uniref:disease resistance protein RPM1-like n=1 Tax=Oryza brachyantha TaxID=4533 RepID=UPI0003EAA34B|nr:disease resistance protein RPM1-like [Oryza brachyantha]
MAEAMILLVVQKIGFALGNEAINQATLKFKNFVTQLTELQGSMGRVRRELKLMHQFLSRMDIRNRHKETYEIWVEEVRMLAHGIEDIVDDYLQLVTHKHKYDTGWNTCLKKGFMRPNILLSLNKIASAIKDEEINLVHLFQAKDRWVSTVGGGNTTTSNESSSYIVERSQHLARISCSLGEEDLVGVDRNKEKLQEWLADDLRGRSVIALHGMGGLGKTALAANAYRREKEKFQCHAWVSISQFYSIKDVLKCLVTELSTNAKKSNWVNINDMDTQGLREELKKFLTHQNCLIVLDDVWAPEAVHDLLGAPAPNLKGSKILLTTRVDDVARLAFEDRRITLKPLSEKESWELFHKTAFLGGTNHEYDAELSHLIDQIVSKCKGVPLAIVSVGRLVFVRDTTKEELRRIHDQLDWELINNPSLEHVRNILYLSYIYLPTQLKSCFLYCSLFPEDHLLKRKALIRWWIAEGFITKRGRSTMEEVAEGYLQELVNRNMLQLIDRNSFGRIKSFRMHDIMHELAVDLSRRECFGVAYDGDNRHWGFEDRDERRLVIQKLNKGIDQAISCAHSLRSVIALDNSMASSSSILRLVADNCRYMSVLELSGLPINMIPDAIGDLFNLRHLGLRGSNVKLLPKSIERLTNLLTLDLFRSSILELPKGIVKLTKLRHLFAEKQMDRERRLFRWCTGVSISKGLEKLTSLQSLQALEAQDESIRCLGELRQMRGLRLWNVKANHCERLCESLLQMKFLSYLSITASDEDDVLQLDGLNPLPPTLHKLRLSGRLAHSMLGAESPLFQADAGGQNLHSLRLFWSQLREDPLASLSQLLNLTELHFTRAYSGEQLVFFTGWFPKLKILRLRDLPNLKRLEIQKGAMISLERLRLINLSSMEEVPVGIEFLMPLKYLSFEEITADFLQSLRQSKIGDMRWWHTLGEEIDK